MSSFLYMKLLEENGNVEKFYTRCRSKKEAYVELWTLARDEITLVI